jgi:hypothetical protein
VIDRNARAYEIKEAANRGGLNLLNRNDERVLIGSASTPYQPIDAIADCNEGKSSADDWSRHAMNAAVLPVSRVSALIDPVIR